MEYKIQSNVFWKNLVSLYNTGLDWHLSDENIQQISKKKLGLKYITTCYTEEINHPYDSMFMFEIIDQDKFLWAKIKYGI